MKIFEWFFSRQRWSGPAIYVPGPDAFTSPFFTWDGDTLGGTGTIRLPNARLLGPVLLSPGDGFTLIIENNDSANSQPLAILDDAGGTIEAALPFGAVHGYTYDSAAKTWRLAFSNAPSGGGGGNVSTLGLTTGKLAIATGVAAIGDGPVENLLVRVAAPLAPGANVVIGATGIDLVVGSSGAGLLIARRILTNAEILALPTTPITVLAAPGAGLSIVPNLNMMVATILAAPYTNIDGTAELDLNVGTINAAFIAAGGNAILTTGGVYIKSSLGGPIINTVIPLASIANEALSVALPNGAAGNLTGGDPANVMVVSIPYQIVPT